MSALNSYGFPYKAAVEARGGRVTANVAPALIDIETLDSDGDGYQNLFEISSNTNAGDAASHPTIAVALSLYALSSEQTGGVDGVRAAVTAPLSVDGACRLA